jgi:hypothetical protein
VHKWRGYEQNGKRGLGLHSTKARPSPLRSILTETEEVTIRPQKASRLELRSVAIGQLPCRPQSNGTRDKLPIGRLGSGRVGKHAGVLGVLSTPDRAYRCAGRGCQRGAGHALRGQKWDWRAVGVWWRANGGRVGRANGGRRGVLAETGRQILLLAGRACLLLADWKTPPCPRELLPTRVCHPPYRVGAS